MQKMYINFLRISQHLEQSFTKPENKITLEGDLSSNYGVFLLTHIEN